MQNSRIVSFQGLRLIVFAFSDNLSAENCKLSAESGLPVLPLLGCMLFSQTCLLTTCSCCLTCWADADLGFLLLTDLLCSAPTHAILSFGLWAFDLLRHAYLPSLSAFYVLHAAYAPQFHILHVYLPSAAFIFSCIFAIITCQQFARQFIWERFFSETFWDPFKGGGQILLCGFCP